ncbi:MAG: Crp/Fnr family transcriptional regulator [Candidatus Marinimicrobia bacterium]|nr:Crp/Fnr family transcriptional regulator [Candidatus Neomarinimicrobiota bacterium]MCH7859775.1 Crp/Fnr family transcriptional regulator [Candidatus Neomarinimicrobiota bacterium]
MAEKTKLWYLQNFNLFKEVDEQTLMEMAVKSHMSRSKKKEVIYFPEEPSDTIYFLKGGKIKLSRISPDGQTTTLALLGAGEIFGESAILGQETHENIAEVVEDALICAIDKRVFQELLEKSNMLNRSVNTLIGDRIRSVESKIEDLVFKDAHERVVDFLARYVKTFGKQLVDIWEVRPFLTHQEIAELTATSRQTVNAILNELKSEGKIDFSRQYLRVPDLQDLMT